MTASLWEAGLTQQTPRLSTERLLCFGLPLRGFLCVI